MTEEPLDLANSTPLSTPPLSTIPQSTTPLSTMFSPTGLSQQQAAERLRSEGHNLLPNSQSPSLLTMAWTVVQEPMFLLLLSCGGIYWLLGSPKDAYILLGSVVIVMAMSLYQARKSEQAIAALRELASPRALVIRDGSAVAIASSDLVREDLIVLSEGDRIPADAALLTSNHLLVDESLLTGESQAVLKQAGVRRPDKMPLPGEEAQCFVYSGTMILQGSGHARVLATGIHSQLGVIGQSLVDVPPESSALQRETRHAVKTIALLSSVLVALFMLGYGLTRGDWLTGILAGLTLAMSLLPAELPLILSIFLGLGAWRLAKKQVLTRQISAIEMLGAATVLCVDKTGTLTQNHMAVQQIISDDCVFICPVIQPPATSANTTDFPERFHQTLEFAMLASHSQAVDPMEIAIQQMGARLLAGTEHLHQNWQLIEDYPLSAELLAMSRVWQSPDLTDYVIAAKGAPEAIIALCHLPDANAINRQINQAASSGLRVLAVASAVFQSAELPALQHDFNFQFLGLIALADPLRPTAKPAIRECLAAGIRVIMITGDYPVTALSIAAESGIDIRGGALSGQDIDALTDAALTERLAKVQVFCRVRPEQKLRLVTLLKQADEIVAMTGDGVNDAPALKAAHIGIAMGGRGTDVARGAAALVLLDDDFGSMVAAVKLGRTIVDNIRKALVFVIAAHIPIAGMSMLPVMLGWPLLLLPVHIVFFELLVDPTCSVVFEAESAADDIMARPPRPVQEKIFAPALLRLGLAQGIGLLLLLMMVYLLATCSGSSEAQVRELTFVAMIVGDVGLILMNRSWRLSIWQASKLPNPALWWVIGVTGVMLALALFVPFLQQLFRFQTPPLPTLAATIITVSAALIMMSYAIGRLMRATKPH